MRKLLSNVHNFNQYSLFKKKFLNAEPIGLVNNFKIYVYDKSLRQFNNKSTNLLIDAILSLRQFDNDLNTHNIESKQYNFLNSHHREMPFGYYYEDVKYSTLSLPKLNSTLDALKLRAYLDIHNNKERNVIYIYHNNKINKDTLTILNNFNFEKNTLFVHKNC